MNQAPNIPTTEALPFGRLSAGENLFRVQPGIPVQLVLEHATAMMGCATALMSETDDADPKLMRSLNRAALHFVEVSQALIEASVDGIVGGDQVSEG
jgi:hypothetical protein